MSEYVYLLRPSFDGAFLERATEEQRGVFEEHGTYLERLYAEGVLLFAGRCLPGPMAIIVIRSRDEEACSAGGE